MDSTSPPLAIMADTTTVVSPAASQSPGSAPSSANLPTSLAFEAAADVGSLLATATSILAHAEGSNEGLAQQQDNDPQRSSPAVTSLTGSLLDISQAQASPQKSAEEPEPARITSDIPHVAPLPPFSTPAQSQSAGGPVAMSAPSFSPADANNRGKRDQERRNALKLALKSPSPLFCWW